MRKVLILLGVPVDDLTMSEALDRIDAFVATGRSHGRPHQIATINADFVVNSLHDPELRRILQEADMTTADGMPLVWGSRLLGVSVEGRVTGADLVPALCERAATRGYSVYLLGARPGVAAQAAELLQQRYPGLIIAGVHSPPNKPLLDMDPAIIDQIKAAKPDILLVAFGNPKQEKWISMHAQTLNVPVSIGIGGTLDMIVGVTKRAPGWMQRVGLEWAYRLLQEPRRLWKRYAVDLSYFSYFYFWQLLAMRRRAELPSLLPTSDAVMVDQRAIISVHGRLDMHSQEVFILQVEQALLATPWLLINLRNADFLDSSALGTLVSFANRSRSLGGALTLVEVPAAITRLLTLVRLDHFFDIQTTVGAAIEAQRTQPASVIETLQQRAAWHVLATPRLVDAATAPGLIEAARKSLDDNAQLVLDLSGTSFIASAGLAALIQINRLATERGGALRVAGATGDTLRIIHLVKLELVLSLYSDVTAATYAATPPIMPVIGATSTPLAGK